MVEKPKITQVHGIRCPRPSIPGPVSGEEGDALPELRTPIQCAAIATAKTTQRTSHTWMQAFSRRGLLISTGWIGN